MGVGERRGRIGTFFWSWKPTCPVAMPAFLWRFDQGV